MATTSTINDTFVIESTFTGMFRVYNRTTQQFLTNRKGSIRLFSSRSGARKAITREKSGNFAR